MNKEEENALKRQIHEVIFEADTPKGKVFDVTLLVLIVLSVIAVMVESIEEINNDYGALLNVVEWVFTVLFSIEYLLRIYVVKKPWKYITSFYGLIDLMSVLPAFLSIIITGSGYLLIVRALRLLRVFRIFKLGRYLGESKILIDALKASREKIIVFIGAVLTMVCIVGAIMYLIEGRENSEQFTSIPRSVYWAIVTVTTVGYGDIAPITPLGQFLAAALMILGYGVIAVPTGIVSSELSKADSYGSLNTISCRSCSLEGHDDDADYCKHCGEKLREEEL